MRYDQPPIYTGHESQTPLQPRVSTKEKLLQFAQQLRWSTQKPQVSVSYEHITIPLDSGSQPLPFYRLQPTSTERSLDHKTLYAIPLDTTAISIMPGTHGTNIDVSAKKYTTPEGQKGWKYKINGHELTGDPLVLPIGKTSSLHAREQSPNNRDILTAVADGLASDESVSRDHAVILLCTDQGNRPYLLIVDDSKNGTSVKTG